MVFHVWVDGNDYSTPQLHFTQFRLLFRKSFQTPLTDLLELRLDLPELHLGFHELCLYRQS